MARAIRWGAAPPRGRRVPWRLVLGVVNVSRARFSDGEAEAADRRVRAGSYQAVHLVRRDIHEVPLGDVPLLAVDDHQALAVQHIVELVGRVGMRVDGAAAKDLELVDQLEGTALG